MIATLAPDTVRDYLHLRMAQRLGAIDAVLARDPLFARGLTFRERLSWMPAMFASILPFAWAARIAIPSLAVLLNIPLIAAERTSDAILVSLSGLIIALIMSGTLFSGIKTLLIGMWSELLETFLAAPSIAMLMRGRDSGDSIPSMGPCKWIACGLLRLTARRHDCRHCGPQPERRTTGGPGRARCIDDLHGTLFLPACSVPWQNLVSGACRPRMNRRLQAELLLGGEKDPGSPG
jgi:hypothetical protein